MTGPNSIAETTIIGIIHEQGIDFNIEGDPMPWADVYIKVKVAFRKKALALLKGPKLSCFLCVALHIDEKGEAYPSIDTIMRETGYSRSVVCNALDGLESLGFIEKVRRKHESTLYRIRGYFWYGSEPSPTLLGESQSSESELSPSQSSEGKRLETKRLESELKDNPYSKDKPQGQRLFHAQGAEKPDYLLHCAEIADKQATWTVPPQASKTNPFSDGPVTAFAEVLAGIPPTELLSKKRQQWGLKLGQIAADWSAEEQTVTPADMERAIRAIPDSGIGWKTYTSPFAKGFAEDIGTLLLGDGPRSQKGTSSHGAHQRDHRIAPGAVPRRVATEEEAHAILG